MTTKQIKCIDIVTNYTNKPHRQKQRQGTTFLPSRDDMSENQKKGSFKFLIDSRTQSEMNLRAMNEYQNVRVRALCAIGHTASALHLILLLIMKQNEKTRIAKKLFIGNK